MSAVAVGCSVPGRTEDLEEVGAALRAMADAGLDHVMMGDHVSFRGGRGIDGLITAALYAALEPRLTCYLSVYLLPLRHPSTVARQLSTLASVAPGRLVFGVGVGGEDRHEVEICGIDPATRGRRMDECLEVLRGLLTGEPVTFRGAYIEVEEAQIVPPPPVPIPIVVGGRSNAAIRRAGRFGEGWLGIWCSTRRFAEAVSLGGRRGCPGRTRRRGRGSTGCRSGAASARAASRPASRYRRRWSGCTGCRSPRSSGTCRTAPPPTWPRCCAGTSRSAAGAST